MTDRSLTLVADIGGTNTRIALADATVIRADTMMRYLNASFANFTDVARAYLAETGLHPRAICVAVAGPVQDGQATLTNLDWTLDEASLRDATGAQDAVITNDLQAQGYAVGHLAADQLTAVVPGQSAPDAAATRLVVGVGTGFNVAPVYTLAASTFVAPSESGHINLPFRTDEQRQLSEALTATNGFASVEDVLSGRGIEALHRFTTRDAGHSPALSAQEIMTACADGDARAMAAVRLAVEILGTVAGNAALTHLPFGGIYLVGGVARAFGPYLGPHGFNAAFRDKGRFSDFMDAFSIWLVTDDYAALQGCAVLMDQRRSHPD